MTDADLIWNRAAIDNGGDSPEVGDRALADLLAAHGLVMNGGVFHAVECLDDNELAAASNGYRHFGLEAIGTLFNQASETLDTGEEIDEREAEFDAAYLAIVADDSSLAERFENRLASHPHEFAPI